MLLLCAFLIRFFVQELIVYQLGQNAIGRLCSINLFTSSERFGVSVIDSLLVVHNQDSKITMVFDVLLHQWTGHPIVAPLPIVSFLAFCFVKGEKEIFKCSVLVGVQLRRPYKLCEIMCIVSLQDGMCCIHR